MTDGTWTMDMLLTRPGDALERLNSFPQREKDLLEANNRYLERARKAESELQSRGFAKREVR